MRGPEDAIDGSETQVALATATIMHESFDEDHFGSAFLAVVVEMLSRSETGVTVDPTGRFATTEVGPPLPVRGNFGWE